MAEETRREQWWLSNQGVPTGPLSTAHVLAGLRSGAISADVQACPGDTTEWKSLCDWAEFTALDPAVALSPRPAATTPRPLAPAWNPQTIARLGLLFGPAWAGSMAAVNARRLEVPHPVWRPLAMGIGATALAIVLCVGYELRDSFLPAALYFAALWTIWRFDLRAQLSVYEQHAAPGQMRDRWLVPAAAGGAAALLLAPWFFVPLFPSPGYARLGWQNLQGAWVEVPENLTADWSEEQRAKYLERFNRGQIDKLDFSGAIMTLTVNAQVKQSKISLPCMDDPQEDRLNFSFYDETMPGKHATVYFRKTEGKIDGSILLAIYDMGDATKEYQLRYAALFRKATEHTQ